MLSQKQLYQVLKFPKHLQVSVTSLLKIGSATAMQVAVVTGKGTCSGKLLSKSVNGYAHCPKRASRANCVFLC